MHQASCRRITPASPICSRQIGHGSFFWTNSRAHRVQHTRLIPAFRRTEHGFYTTQAPTVALPTRPKLERATCLRSRILIPVLRRETRNANQKFFQKGGFNMTTVDESGPHRQIVAHLALAAQVQNLHVTWSHAIHQYFRSASGPAPELMVA